MTINQRTDKVNVVDSHNEILFSNKKESMIHSTSWMNFRNMLSERSETQETTFTQELNDFYLYEVSKKANSQ